MIPDWNKELVRRVIIEMLNEGWAKRILRARKTEVVASDYITTASDTIHEVPPQGDDFTFACYVYSDEDFKMPNCVKDNEKIMHYLQKENASGYAHNLDMLLGSLNLNQHLREAFLSAEVSEDDTSYKLRFPFGTKTIEYILSKKAVDAE